MRYILEFFVLGILTANLSLAAYMKFYAPQMSGSLGPLGINDADMISGTFSSPFCCGNPPIEKGFIYSLQNGLQLFSVPGYQVTSAGGLNSIGDIVGEAFTYDANFNVISQTAYLH